MQSALWEETMLTINHILTAGILVAMMAFSPVTISLMQETGPMVATISQTGR
jgi:hypothetical protein